MATAKRKPERIKVFRRPIPPAKIRVTGGNAKTVPTKYRVHVKKVNSLAPGSIFKSPVITLLKEIKFVVCDQYPISDPNKTAPNTAAPVALMVFGNWSSGVAAGGGVSLMEEGSVMVVDVLQYNIYVDGFS
jgi:hypothetical protein